MLYTQDQIKDILWKTFTVFAKEIKFLEQVGNEYWYEVTLEDGIDNEQLGHIGLELHETDLFDVVNKGDNKMLVKYVGENDLMDVQEFRKFNAKVNEASDDMTFADSQVKMYKKMFDGMPERLRNNTFLKSVMNQMEKNKKLTKKQFNELNFVFQNGKTRYEAGQLSTKY